MRFLFICFVLVCCPLLAEEPNGILVDAVHCNEHSDIGLQRDNTDYHHICGSRFGLEYIKSRGIRCDRLTDGRLTDEVLSKYKLLFFNLLSADRPGFLVSEIQAIVRFIKSGGAMLVITDHSNCYFHASMLEPLFTELDIETKRTTVCDRVPYTLGTGSAWILVSHFEEHALTQGLRFLGVQTGGEVDARFAVAWSGPFSWADNWYCPPYLETGAERRITPGFYGNLSQDVDEPTGKRGVLLAKEFGKGRIVILNDQNMISDTFINYADNYRLWLNSFSWLLRDESLADPVAYGNWRPEGHEKEAIWAVECFDRADFGCDYEHNMYHAWALLNRYYWAFAYDRRPPHVSCRLAIHADSYNLASPEMLKELVQFLREGKNLLLLHTSPDVLDEPDSMVCEILKELGEEKPVLQNCSSELYKPDELPEEGGFYKTKLRTGGTIMFFESLKHFSNSRIPHPTEQPKEEDAAHVRLFLDLVKNALQEQQPRTEHSAVSGLGVLADTSANSVLHLH